MKVLHYSLGVPPYRSGGLTAWSMDLIDNQLQNGIEVSLLYPGRIRVINNKIFIKKPKLRGNLSVFELINPLPVPLIYAIDSGKHYLEYDSSVDFTNFFRTNNFDVIHLHTLMGLPLEFLQQAKAAGIRIIYTAHDTFGVWPEPDLNTENIEVDPVFNLGYIGNQRTLSYASIVMMQSVAYRTLKNAKAIKLLKQAMNRLRTKSQRDHAVESTLSYELRNTQLYNKLRGRYKIYFSDIDFIHYNSEFTKNTFEAYGVVIPSVVLPVYHSNMHNRPVCTNLLDRNNEKIIFLYNGTHEQYKGYYLLLSVFDELRNEGLVNFELKTYGSKIPDRSYISTAESYSIDNLEEVYAGVDITVVPSLCHETFGMVVAESLNFSTPVIVSKNVGAKFLLNRKYGYEFKSRIELKKYIKNLLLNPEIIMAQKNTIFSSKSLVFDSSAIHAKILNLYTEEARR